MVRLRPTFIAFNVPLPGRVILTPDQTRPIMLLVIVLAGCLLYLLPIGIATWRHRRNALSIGVVNIFLGWTFIG